MNKAKDRIIEGLKQAMQAESDGYHFYKMAANSTEDPEGKEVFESLAADELEHLRFLKTQYKSILETGKPDKNTKLEKPATLSGESPIFSEQFKSRLKKAHYEMSALSIGAQLELSSIKFYKSQAEAVGDPTIRSFYSELAEWETTHYRRLIRQQKELKEDYWFKGGFYPF